MSSSALNEPVKVLLTVDTECWPRDPGIGSGIRREQLDLRRYLRRDIYGETERGAFGVPLQMELLRASGLRGVFFVEALFASIVGLEPLREIVALVQDAGHEVQLHAHTEWLQVDPNAILEGRLGRHIRDFTLEEQRTLLTLARDNLRAAGAQRICAYRAGNFGANNDTLRALASIGIPFDSSHNAACLTSSCRISTDGPPSQATSIEGVWEIPVSCFEDLPGHVRPAQLCSCSTQELTHALLGAWKAGWTHFVVVTHSNELLDRRGDGPNPIVLNRYRALCKFLGDNGDKFVSTTFGDLQGAATPLAGRPATLRSNAFRTAHRIGEQIVQRWLF